MSPVLQGRHALVCGGSEGIGLATAEALAAMGADVTVLARRPERLAEVTAALPRVHESQRHGFVTADGMPPHGNITRALLLPSPRW